MTRIFKNGDFYIFQDESNLDRINTLNIAETTYDVSRGRHYFRQVRGERLLLIYSFAFADILNQEGVAYTDAEAFINYLSDNESNDANQVIHRLVSAVSTNDTLIRAGSVKLYKAVITNDAAVDQYVKYYDKVTAPVVGTDIPIITLTVESKKSIEIDFGGVEFQYGLGIGVTGAIPDNDTTNTAADDVFISTFIDKIDVLYEGLIGIINGAATVTATATSRREFLGVVNGAATVTGTLIAMPKLAGASNGVATVTALLLGIASIAGNTNGSPTLVSGDLTEG